VTNQATTSPGNTRPGETPSDATPDWPAETGPTPTRSDGIVLHGMQEHLAEFPEEVVSVGSREVPELRRANLRIDPVLFLADDRFHRVRVWLDRLKPVLDAQLNCVRSRGADTTP
jgi:hypothetical protein